MGVQRTPKGFAVVDFETTGINPMGGDRAIEVGIVHVAPDGTLEDEAETLIRVQRDLGAQNLHHIHAADLMDAPDFAGIAAELRDWLDGYVFVAHNAVFDSRFLNAEYNRIGYTTPVDRTTSICTLRLSNRFLGLRSLDDCCRELGIRNTDAHSALGDAHATALLLSGFLHGIPDWEGWRPALRLAAELEWPRIEERPHPWVPRQSHAAHRPVSPFLNRLQSGNPGAARYRHHDAAMLDAAADYVALLDKCLIDARLSEHEKNALVDTARELGLTREQCLRIHEQYFADAADEAWIDGRLTDDEERELRQVGALLSIEPDMIDRAIAVPPFSDAATGRHARRHSPAAPHHDADDVSSVQPDSGASPESQGSQGSEQHTSRPPPFIGGRLQRRRAARRRLGQARGPLHDAGADVRPRTWRQRRRPVPAASRRPCGVDRGHGTLPRRVDLHAGGSGTGGVADRDDAGESRHRGGCRFRIDEGAQGPRIRHPDRR